MRTIACLLALAALALAHGGSTRQPGTGSTGTTVVPHRGDPDEAPPGITRGPTTPGDSRTISTWDVWWSYNMEYILAMRRLGVTVTRTRPTLRETPNSQLERYTERVRPVAEKAIRDKNHSVRGAAYIVLGKLSDKKYLELLDPKTRIHGEGWWNSREAAIYAIALLSDPENRPVFKALIGDKARKVRERALALTGYALDKDSRSSDDLVWYMRNKHSGIVAIPEAFPHQPEDEFRRYATHLLGFVENADEVERDLWKALSGTLKRGPAIQGLALTALARRKDPDVLEECFRLAYSRRADNAVRRSAAVALGGLLKPTDVDDIRRLAQMIRDRRNDSVQQHFAIMSLGQIGGKTAIDALLDLVRTRVFGAAQDRGFVYLALGLCGAKSKPAREFLMTEFRKASTADERASLAMALGLMRHRDAVPQTIEYLQKSNLATGRKFLAFGSLALGLHADPRGSPAVRKVFATYSDAAVRRHSALGLVLIEKDAAVPELMRVLRKSGNNATRIAIVAAFSDLHRPSDKIIDALVEVYRDDSIGNEVRARAIAALGVLVDPRPIPVSAQLIRLYNYFIRSHALDEVASWM